MTPDKQDRSASSPTATSTVFRKYRRSVPYVFALNPAHAWWHPKGVAGSVKEVAREAGWVSTTQPGRWVQLTRTFRDGSEQVWWAVEIVAGPYGRGKPSGRWRRD